jgi:hypothetical protein
MIRSWWKRYLYAVGAGNHLERCTFCDQTFDIRDPGQVLVHQNHQLAAGASHAIDPISEDKPPPMRNVVPFRRRGER